MGINNSDKLFTVYAYKCLRFVRLGFQTIVILCEKAKTDEDEVFVFVYTYSISIRRLEKDGTMV